MTDNVRDTEFSDRATDRLIFFSDAVVAIAMTLLALDLPVPSGRTLHEFLHSINDNSDTYVAFLISFVVIALHWLGHHRFFDYLARTDRRLRTLNILWLFAIVLLPFATRLLNDEHGTLRIVTGIRFAFYALLQAVAYALFLIMVNHMVKHRLTNEGAPARLLPITRWTYGAVIAGFGLSVPLFLWTTWAWVVWIVVPVVMGQLRRRRNIV